MIAQATGLARLTLAETEADQLAASAANVAQFYDMPAIAPETLAWCGLIQTLAMIYGSRILAARADASKARAARQANGAAAPKPEAQPPNPQFTKTIVGGVEFEVPAPGTH